MNMVKKMTLNKKDNIEQIVAIDTNVFITMAKIDENYINNIRFIIINVRCNRDFYSDIANDTTFAFSGMVFLQKFQNFIREAHQQQAFRFIYKKLQRE